MEELNGGEGNGFYRCEGEGVCELFTATAGNFEEKSRICADCLQCKGKAPLPKNVNSPEIVQQKIVFHIENLVLQIDSGQPFDWNALDYLDWKLIEIWRQKEFELERFHKSRIKFLFESMAKEK